MSSPQHPTGPGPESTGTPLSNSHNHHPYPPFSQGRHPGFHDPSQPFPQGRHPGYQVPLQPFSQAYAPDTIPPDPPGRATGVHRPGAGANLVRGSAFHTLRTLRGPVRIVLRILSIIFGIATIGGVLVGINDGSWGMAIGMFVGCVLINAVRWWYDSAVARTAPEGTTMIRPM